MEMFSTEGHVMMSQRIRVRETILGDGQSMNFMGIFILITLW